MWHLCHFMSFICYMDEFKIAPLLSNVENNKPQSTCVLQYPLYTIIIFDEWINAIFVAFFVVSQTRKHDLHHVLHVLHYTNQTLNDDWKPSSNIVDNTQTKINMLKYSFSKLHGVVNYHPLTRLFMSGVIQTTWFSLRPRYSCSMACLQGLGGEHHEENIHCCREDNCTLGVGDIMYGKGKVHGKAYVLAN